MKRASAGKKRDANERSIVDALRAAGATVLQLSEPNAPDLLVGRQGTNYLAEVKTAKGMLNEGQALWIARWGGGRVHVLRTPEDALEMIGLKVRRTG